MKWLLSGVGVVLLLLAALFGIGSFLITPRADTAPLYIPRLVALLLLCLGALSFYLVRRPEPLRNSWDRARSKAREPRPPEPEYEPPPLPRVEAFQVRAHQPSNAAKMKASAAQMYMGGIFLALVAACTHIYTSQPHIALVAMGAFCLTVGVGCLVWPFAGKYAKAPREAEIALHSLRWLESHGKWLEAAWGDIAEVYRVERIVNGFRIQSCRVKTAESEVTFLATVDGYDQMVTSIQTATTRSLLPAKAADLECGNPVAFGPVTLYPDGVGLLVETGPESPGERFVRWEEVRDVKVKRGRLMVFPTRKPYPVLDHLPVPLGAIPNYFVLLEMLLTKGFRV